MTATSFLKECLALILLWMILAILLISLLPCLLVATVLRYTEVGVFRYKYNACKLPSQDVLYTMTRPENRMIITGFLQVDQELPIDRLRVLLQRNLLDRVDNNGKKLYPKATKHVYPGYINYYWVEDKSFQIDKHVYELTNEPIKSQDELKTLIGNHYSKPLEDEYKQSPWEFVSIPYCTEEGERKTIILYKLAHVIADGSSLAYFLINFLADKSEGISTHESVVRKKFTQVDRSLLLLKGLWRLPLFYLRMALTKEDKNTLYSVELSGQKNVTWSKPFSVTDIKCIKNIFQTTVNDVLVGNLAKSLHDYFEIHKLDSENVQTFSAIIPVDVRSSISQAQHFENHVAGIMVQLPVVSPEMAQTIQETKDTFDNVKHNGIPLSVNLGWRYISFLLPAWLARIFVFSMVNKTTGIVSNIVGPQCQISIDGHPVEFLTFWPPQTNNQTIGVSFCSYHGNIRIGIAADSKVMLNPDKLVTLYENNLNVLVEDVKLK